MAISPLLRPLGIAAAILGACQGLVWTVLCLLSVLIGTEAWIPEFDDDQVFESTVYLIFFNPNLMVGIGDDLIMTGDVFMGFSFFYLVISFVWMVTSLTMLWVLFREKWIHARYTIKTWSIITGIISLFDFIVIIMLAVDYHHMVTTLPGALSYIFEVAIGSVMAIVARGYVLWVAHVILVVFLVMWANQITDHDSGKERDHRPYINGYDDPWQTSEQPRFPRAIDNQGFQPDDRNFARSFSQEQQLQQQQQQQRRFVPPTDPHAQTLPQKPPKPRAPQGPPQHHQQLPQQHQQQGPYIPHPDYPNYSPNDLERMPRSALKNRSYYN